MARVYPPAIREIRASVTGDLLDLLLSASPTFFEAIVLDVLHNMGYGASKASLQRVGGSNDGGIDGIISLDKLGLEKAGTAASLRNHVNFRTCRTMGLIHGPARLPEQRFARLRIHGGPVGPSRR